MPAKDSEASADCSFPGPGNPLHGFLAALQFLTISPAFIRRHLTPRELGQATAFFPLVGLTLGAILVAGYELLSILFPPSTTAALLLGIWFLLSGAFHLDGFLDACDGLLGGRTPEKRLEIMKDERVGAFGLVGGVLMILLKFAAISSLATPSSALILAPTLGRWSMTVSIFAFPYAREDGLGRVMKDHIGSLQVLIASILAFGISFVAGGVFGLLILIASLIVVWIFGFFTLRRIPGMTGDTYGALNEVVELVILLIFTITLQPII